MVRFITTGTAAVLVAAVLAGIPAAKAQQNEGPWKKDVMEALQAAGAKNYPRAEKSFLAALQEAKKFGVTNVRVGTTLNTLGLVYRAEKKYSDAEAAYKRALIIMETTYGNNTDV